MTRKRPRRHLAASGSPPLQPRAAGHVWAHDFGFVSYATGHPLQCLTAVDEFAFEGPAIDVEGNMRSGRVMEVLS